MSRDWKPGDLAMVVNAAGEERVARFTGQWADDVGEMHWRFADGSHLLPREVTQARPLVVIDLPNGAKAGWSTLVDALKRARETTGLDMVFGGLIEQIEAQTAPPKPAEPTGLGAVIEAVCGCNDEVGRYVRDPDARDFNLPRDAKNVATGVQVPWVSRCGHHRYVDLDDVRVLSEGVPND